MMDDPAMKRQPDTVKYAASCTILIGMDDATNGVFASTSIMPRLVKSQRHLHQVVAANLVLDIHITPWHRGACVVATTCRNSNSCIAFRRFANATRCLQHFQ
jgi:hypothetical protein